MWEAIIILAVFIVAVSVTLVRINKDPRAMSFREAMDLTELPIVTFYVGEKKLNFLLDTGANTSIMDSTSLESVPYEKTNYCRSVTGMEGNSIETPVVIMNLSYRDKIYKEEFQSVDMSAAFGAIKQESGVTVNGILGNAFFTKYKYVLDFKDLIAYSKK